MISQIKPHTLENIQQEKWKHFHQFIIQIIIQIQIQEYLNQEKHFQFHKNHSHIIKLKKFI